MFKRPTTGSIVCPDCGRLVGVRDEKCLGCGRSNPGMWGFTPMINQLGRNFGFSEVIVAGCSGLFIITLLLRDPSTVQGLMSMLSPGQKALFLFGASGFVPVFEFGRWWTVLSAAWLHGGILHILMNMLWIRQLVPALSEYYGVGRLVIIYTVSSITGFAATTFMGLFGLPGPLRGAAFTVGASAPLFGLFGALVLYGQVTGQSRLTRQVWQWVIIFVVIGLLLPFIDNWAHLGGFAGGWLAGRILDPRRSETPRHLLVALICLVLTLLSIIVSVIHGRQFL